MKYTILYNMPGYLPEMEPYIVDSISDAIDAVYEEIENMADEILDNSPDEASPKSIEWETILLEVEGERLRLPNEFDFSFSLPNRYVIEAVRQ